MQLAHRSRRLLCIGSSVHSSVHESLSGRAVAVEDITGYAPNGIDGCTTRDERRTRGRVA